MNKNTEQFQWTNELLKEWAEYYIIHEGDNLLEKFIQSKSKTEQPLWEILSYSNPNVFTDVLGGNIVDAKGSGANYAILKNFPIHSVKRLSDGEVFSVGDSLDWMGEIKSIEIDDKFNGGIAFINNSQKSCISTAKKAPKEEQVPIKVESIAFYTSFGEKQIRDTFAVNLSNNISEDKLQQIKSAIERELNNYKDERPVPYASYKHLFDQHQELLSEFSKMHTSEELLQAIRDAFHAGISFDCWNVSSHQYAKFEDYINSLNK